MVKEFSKLVRNWIIPIIFLIGLGFIAAAAWSFNSALGLLVIGIELIILAIVSDMERG